jgi:hypothetical protein
MAVHKNHIVFRGVASKMLQAFFEMHQSDQATEETGVQAMMLGMDFVFTAEIDRLIANPATLGEGLRQATSRLIRWLQETHDELSELERNAGL